MCKKNTESSGSIERRIVIGLIVSTEYLEHVEGIWDDEYIGSEMALRLSSWCWEYFKKYREAPYNNIESIFEEKIKHGLPKDIVEEIDDEILPSLNDEFEKGDTRKP